MNRELYVFIQVTPVEQSFVRVLGYTDDPNLVFQLQGLLRHPLAFKGAKQRLESQVLECYSDESIVNIINNMISTELSFVDELIVQKAKFIQYKK